ncbi:MAG: hypothetical protein QXR58_00355 [Candidatus Micrarchaeaceae archaeon]
MAIRVYVCDKADYEKLKNLLEYDPYLDTSLGAEQLAKLRGDRYANIIFARQSYTIKDGALIGMDAGKYYLYLKAPEEFFQGAEEKLSKEIQSCKRADAETERKIISIVEEDESKGNYGVGLVLGG